MKFPTFISKEVAITCGMFLFIFILGNNLLSSVTDQTSSKITSAAVVSDEETQTQQGAIIKKGRKGVLGFLSDEDQYDKKALEEIKERKAKAGNLITGKVIGLTPENAPDQVQVGEYSITPSLVLDAPGAEQLTRNYELLNKERETFIREVQQCVQEKAARAATENALNSCVTAALETPAFSSWLSEEKCESPTEQVFYDFTQSLKGCTDSQQQQCLCQIPLAYKRGYGAATYKLTFANTPMGMKITTLDAEEPITILIPSISLRTMQKPELNELLYSATYDQQKLEQIYFGERREEQSLFSLGDTTLQLTKEQQDVLFAEKQAQTITFLTSEEAEEAEARQRPWCSQQDNTLYKFCVPEGSTGALHIFAIDFK